MSVSFFKIHSKYWVVVLVTLCELDSLEGPWIVMYFLDINLSSDLNKLDFPDRQTFIRLSHVYHTRNVREQRRFH